MKNSLMHISRKNIDYIIMGGGTKIRLLGRGVFFLWKKVLAYGWNYICLLFANTNRSSQIFVITSGYLKIVFPWELWGNFNELASFKGNTLLYISKKNWLREIQFINKLVNFHTIWFELINLAMGFEIQNIYTHTLIHPKSMIDQRNWTI